jgi:hypothetical protein
MLEVEWSKWLFHCEAVRAATGIVEELRRTVGGEQGDELAGGMDFKLGALRGPELRNRMVEGRWIEVQGREGHRRESGALDVI